jgi:hypothetical protein
MMNKAEDCTHSKTSRSFVDVKESRSVLECAQSSAAFYRVSLLESAATDDYRGERRR